MSSLKDLVKLGKQAKPFLGGLLFGTLGLKALGSKEAKRLYANVLAKGLHARDYIEASVDEWVQQGGDVLAEAQAIYQSDLEENPAFEDSQED